LLPIEYDHFDTFYMVLKRFQKQNNQTDIQSLYSVDQNNGRIQVFNENDFVFYFKDQILHGSKCTWTELRNKQRSWSYIVSNHKILQQIEFD
jgi:hypothetical protein